MCFFFVKEFLTIFILLNLIITHKNMQIFNGGALARSTMSKKIW